MRYQFVENNINVVSYRWDDIDSLIDIYQEEVSDEVGKDVRAGVGQCWEDNNIEITIK
jgi:tetrahydromethanopterin S-methyltransferase subunit G